MNWKHTPFSRVINVGSLTVLFIIASTFIYYAIGHGDWTLFDCFYMTIISITTVGYGEIMDFSGNIWGRVFSIIVVLWGYFLLVYFVSVLSELLVTGQINKFYKTKKGEKDDQNLPESLHNLRFRRNR
ncbi:MAG TPA: potassium channel family protein [bacterium]|nr:potassium channel family protein [bacterium]HPS29436.1 potassium channel family protein [bacterium]